MSSGSGPRALPGRLALDVWYGKPAPVGGAYRRAVHWDEEGSAIARQVLASGRPALVARFGSSELACVSFYTRWRARTVVRLAYPEALRRVMRLNAGMFPTDNASLDRFSEVFLNAVSKTDVMGVWFNRNEHRIVSRFCPDAQLVQLEALNCVLRKDPWSAELEGKVVLVVHPFARMIESQYRTRRTLLFDNPKICPSSS